MTKEKVSIEGEDYNVDDLSNIQRYMLQQVVDLEKQLAVAMLRLDQLKVAKAEFGNRLAVSVKEAETKQ